MSLAFLVLAIVIGNTELHAQTTSTTKTVVPVDSSDLAKKRAAIDANPLDLEAHKAFLLAYNKYARANGVTENYYDPLAKQYEELMKKYPESYVIPYAYGNALTRSESPKAKPWLLKAVAINPKFALAYMDLWSDAERWGDFEGGRKYLGMAAEADPSNADIAFYYASSFDDIDWAKYRTMSLDVAKRFSTIERGAQALYWLAHKSKDDKEKVAIWEQLRAQFPADKFSWASSGMGSYFDYLIERDPLKALELAQSMASLKFEEYSTKTWANNLAIAQNVVKAKSLLSEKKPAEALAVLNDTKFSKYSRAREAFAIFKAKTIEATGNKQAAYDSLATFYAKEPSDRLGNELQQLGSKVGKNAKNLKEDVAKIRYATAQPATPFALEQYFKPGTASLSDYKGKVVLLTYWFPGCGPCRGEFPHFENVVRKFKGRDFVYLGLNIFPDQDEYVVPFLKNSGYSFIPLKDVKGRNKGNMDNRNAAPVNYLLDKDGNIIFSWFRTDESNGRTLELMISELL